MKGKMTRLLAWALALLLVLGVCAGIAENTNSENPEATVFAATNVPETTNEPEGTNVPETTGEPEGTSVPEMTNEPEGTNAPETTGKPEGTNVPEATNEPEGTDVPEGTDEPDGTNVPETTDEPEGTKAPEAADVPAPVNETGETNTSENGELNGTTAPVDNSTALADGSYTPENFSYSGGSGKTKITCNAVTVSNGKATANITFSSASWEYVKASGGKYDAKTADGKASFEIPVDLNTDNRILAMTSAMSTPKEVEYSIHITLDETPTATSTPEPEALEDGDYDFSVESDFKMFKVISSSAKVENGRISVTLRTSSASYDRIYLGAKEDTDRSSVILGTANGSGGYDFIFELSKDYLGQSINFVPGKPDGSWYEKNQYHLTIPATLVKAEATPTPEPTDAPEATATPEPSATAMPEVSDGEYNAEVGNDNSMFNVVSCVLKVQNGAYTATITLSGTGYDQLYIGTAEAAAAADASSYIAYVPNAEGLYTFTIPVSKLDVQLAIAAHAVKSGEWKDKPLTFKSAGLNPLEPDVADGEYNAEVGNDNSMFNVVSCVLKVQNGAYTATITLSGTGYDQLYIGTAEAAAAADASSYIAYVPNAEGLYTFTIPVSKLDVQLAIAAHAVKSGEWKDKPLTFKSEGLEAIGGGETEATPTPEPTATPAPSATAEPELDGSTSAVDSSTTLKDGVYTPDKFSWSGGSGRISISCSRVTVSGGKATATLVFSSKNIGYVKANGRKYYPSVSGGSSTVNIPVKLNSNNKIIGMTTAMSAAHEVTYTIYVYIQAADANAAAADTDAPTLAGLQYESTETLEFAKLVKIYRYQGGFAMIEVEDAGRYLTVPEGAEIPVGLDEDATLILLPVQSAYVADEAALLRIDAIEIPEEKDAVRAIGVENPTLARMKAAELEYAGAYDAPDYAALLKLGCDLAIMPSAFAAEDAEASLAEVRERLALLGIPLFVDRSADEESEEARREWAKVYGILLGCEEEALAYLQSTAA